MPEWSEHARELDDRLRAQRGYGIVDVIFGRKIVNARCGECGFLLGIFMSTQTAGEPYDLWQMGVWVGPEWESVRACPRHDVTIDRRSFFFVAAALRRYLDRSAAEGQSAVSMRVRRDRTEVPPSDHAPRIGGGCGRCGGTRRLREGRPLCDPCNSDLVEWLRTTPDILTAFQEEARRQEAAHTCKKCGHQRLCAQAAKDGLERVIMEMQLRLLFELLMEGLAARDPRLDGLPGRMRRPVD